MYYFLSGAIVDRTINDLRQYWAYNPEYRDDLVDNIQGSYAFRERPQHGIVVKMSGANRVRLAADNYVGKLKSYVALAGLHGYKSLSAEWVREDSIAIQDNGGFFPSPAGVYVIEMLEEDEPNRVWTFDVQPYYDVKDEAVAMTSDTEGMLQSSNFEPGTLYLVERPAGFLLREGIHYTADPNTGQITLTNPIPKGVFISADYKIKQPKCGPFKIRENRAHHKAIPGVLIAFGRRVDKCDKFAVIVTERREETAYVYGGRWDINMDIEIISRDVHSQREIADQTVMYMMSILRSHWGSVGLEIMDISLGGETEEVYDDVADDYYFNSSISMTVQTDWEVYVPIIGYLREIIPLTQAQMEVAGLAGNPELVGLSNLEVVGDISKLRAIRDPFFLTLSRSFETIR